MFTKGKRRKRNLVKRQKYTSQYVVSLYKDYVFVLIASRFTDKKVLFRTSLMNLYPPSYTGHGIVKLGRKCTPWGRRRGSLG